MIVGHQALVERIAAEAPRVSLLLGPESVGKWTSAEQIRREWGVEGTDVLRVYKLTADDARRIVKFAQVAPVQELKVVIVQLSRHASPQHILLKALEESAENVRFLLVSTRVPLLPIVSRAQRYDFPLLTSDQVAEVLRTRLRVGAGDASRASLAAGGRVRVAVEHVENDGSDKTAVISVLKAFRERDAAMLERAAEKWNEARTELLILWCIEARTKLWKIFTPAESADLPPGLPLRMLMALNAPVRPKLAVRVGLVGLLKEI